MIEWNERHLKELIQRMRLWLTPEQESLPVYLSLYGPSYDSKPLLTKIMRLDANAWTALGYTETDRVSVTRYLGSLGCRTDWALSRAAEHQQPLTLELAKSLIDAGAFNKHVLSIAVQYQQPLTPELAKLLIDAGAFNERALSTAAGYRPPLTLELVKRLSNW